MLPRSQRLRQGRNSVPIKARLGLGILKSGAGSVKSRLGVVGGPARQRLGVAGPGGRLGAKALSQITDARQKILLNRTNSGRVGKARVLDARDKIEANRQHPSMRQGLPSKGIGPGSMSFKGQPIRNLIITTPVTPARGSLFHSAVSGMGMSQWDYPPPSHFQAGHYTSHSSYASEPMLTRTISNFNPQPPQRQPSSSFARSPPRFRSDYVGSSKSSDMYMDMDVDAPPIRQSVQSRLDSPQYKVRVSNLQTSVTVDDVIELLTDVGDLITAKSLGPGVVEAYYRSKNDCVKAVEAYHNRLLDGRPMKVVLEGSVNNGKAASGTGTSLKSAAGATSSIKLPKSSSSIKIHPDITAIHKVLFQPTSSSNTTKMLFKGAGQ